VRSSLLGAVELTFKSVNLLNEEVFRLLIEGSNLGLDFKIKEKACCEINTALSTGEED
jgi:hypothetical protein